MPRFNLLMLTSLLVHCIRGTMYARTICGMQLCAVMLPGTLDSVVRGWFRAQPYHMHMLIQFSDKNASVMLKSTYMAKVLPRAWHRALQATSTADARTTWRPHACNSHPTIIFCTSPAQMFNSSMSQERLHCTHERATLHQDIVLQGCSANRASHM
jgi:hypothetical protein